MSQYYRDRATILQQQQPNMLQHIVRCCNIGPKPPKNGKHNRSYASQDILGELENTKMQGVASQLGNHSGQPQINWHTTKRSITIPLKLPLALQLSPPTTHTKPCSFLQISPASDTKPTVRVAGLEVVFRKNPPPKSLLHLLLSF